MKRAKPSSAFKATVLLIGLIGIMAAALIWSGIGPRAVEAAFLIEDVLAGPGASRLKDVRPFPSRRAVTYTHEGTHTGVHAGTSRQADVYWPGDAPAKALVILLPGASPAGRNHPALVRFARSLARVGFQVVVPELDAIRRLEMSSRDIDAMGKVIEAVAGRCMGGAANSLGLMALSYAAGPAVLAARDAPAVGFLLAVGAYYDLTEAITYLTTGAYRLNGEWRPGAPNPYALWAFARSNAAWLAAPSDRRTLQEIAARKLENPDADVSGLDRSLGPEGRAVLRLIRNRDPEQVPELIAALPQAIRSELAALDLSSLEFSGLDAHILLIHGRDDPMIPFTASRALAQRVDEAGGQAALFVLESLHHVEWSAATLAHRIGDGLKLWRAAYALLAQRDRLPPPAPCFE